MQSLPLRRWVHILIDCGLCVAFIIMSSYLLGWEPRDVALGLLLLQTVHSIHLFNYNVDLARESRPTD